MIFNPIFEKYMPNYSLGMDFMSKTLKNGVFRFFWAILRAFPPGLDWKNLKKIGNTRRPFVFYK
jgi:hypothetical protein